MTAYSKPGAAIKSAIAPVSASESSTRVRLLVVLLLMYVWWYVATPYIRFSELSDIRFERILVAMIGLGIVFSGALASRPSPFNFLIPLFFAWMYLSFLLSPYSDLDAALYWQSEYWKVVVLYFFVSFGLRDRNDLYYFLIGVAVISLTYQLHSWLDFLRGGSYVYQQGIKRMVGVWSGGGIGSANAWGMLALFTLPFAMFGLRASPSRSTRLAMIALVIMSAASIVFSGTRGAMVGLVILTFAYGGFRVLRPKYLLPAIAILAIGFAVMPQEYRHRYSLIFINEESDVTTRDDVIASGSAHSRIEGLIDGFNMAMLRPLTGMGPGASPTARLEVRDDAPQDEDGGFLQLHNLYGQVMAELGLIGMLIFLVMIAMYFRQLQLVRVDNDSETPAWRQFKQVMVMAMFVMLLYGMFTHSLYRFHWMLLFACHNVLMNIAPRVQVKTLSGRLK
jgi:O-antigen ligase